MWKKKSSSLFCPCEIKEHPRQIVILPKEQFFSIASGRKTPEDKYDFVIYPSMLKLLSKFTEVVIVSFVNASRTDLSMFDEIRKSISLNVSFVIMPDGNLFLAKDFYLANTKSLMDNETVVFLSDEKENEAVSLRVPENTVALILGNPKCGKSSLALEIAKFNECPIFNSVDSINFVPCVVDINFMSSERDSFIKNLQKEGKKVVIFWIVKDGRIHNSKLDFDKQVSSATYNHYSEKFSKPVDGEIRIVT